jgi:hypothetical protein
MDKIISRQREYTEELYTEDPNTSIEFQEKTYTQESLVMTSEVRKALWEVTGIDKMPIELIKAAGEAVITALTALCQQWLQE